MTKPQPQNLILDGDAAPLLGAVEVLQGAVRDGSFRLSDLRELVSELLSGAPELIRVHADTTTAFGTSECLLTLQPSHLFLDRVAALAGDRDSEIVKKIAHFVYPSKSA